MKKNKQKSCLQPSPKSPRQYVYVMRFCSVKQVYDVLGTIFVYVYTKYNSLYTVRLSFIIHKHSRTWMQIPGNSQTITARSKTCHENHCCTHHHHLHHPMVSRIEISLMDFTNQNPLRLLPCILSENNLVGFEHQLKMIRECVPVKSVPLRQCLYFGI